MSIKTDGSTPPARRARCTRRRHDDDDDDDGDGARGWEARARSSGGVADGRETMRVGV